MGSLFYRSFDAYEQQMNVTALSEAPAAPAPAAQRARFRLLYRRETRAAFGFGILSGILYFLLYQFGNDLRQLAELTRQGDKIYFLVPIAIAFAFSLVHGKFTSRFWEAVGLRAKL